MDVGAVRAVGAVHGRRGGASRVETGVGRSSKQATQRQCKLSATTAGCRASGGPAQPPHHRSSLVCLDSLPCAHVGTGQPNRAALTINTSLTSPPSAQPQHHRPAPREAIRHVRLKEVYLPCGPPAGRSLQKVHARQWTTATWALGAAGAEAGVAAAAAAADGAQVARGGVGTWGSDVLEPATLDARPEVLKYLHGMDSRVWTW